MIEKVIATALRDDAVLEAILGGKKVFPVIAPQDVTPPIIVYQRISTDRVTKLNEGMRSTATTVSRTQVTVYDARPATDLTYTKVRDASDRIRKVLDGLAGTLQGIELADMSIENDRDQPVSPSHGDEYGVAGVALDVVARWYET